MIELSRLKCRLRSVCVDVFGFVTGSMKIVHTHVDMLMSARVDKFKKSRVHVCMNPYSPVYFPVDFYDPIQFFVPYIILSLHVLYYIY